MLQIIWYMIEWIPSKHFKKQTLVMIFFSNPI